MVDTPETTFGWYRCDAELERGLLAAKRLAEILDSGAIDIEFATRRDRYKRRLARLTVDGRDVGEILIGERLAVRYGCPLTAA
jgi:endonuclease YncB( thermonuclease family)